MLDDSDITKAAQAASKSRFLNTGQGYIAAKRFIVLGAIIDDFKKVFELEVNKLKVGDPMNEETDIGPVAKKEFVRDLEKILEDAKKKGVEPIICGKDCERGFFFRPALIPSASLEMEACNVEVFGPIAPLITVKDDDEAIKIANSTEFGLGAEVWSGNLDRAEKLAKRIKSGFVVVNGMVRSGPRLPFGGVKKSGVGKELSHYGLKEFTNVKAIVVNR